MIYDVILLYFCMVGYIKIKKYKIQFCIFYSFSKKSQKKTVRDPLWVPYCSGTFRAEP